jgi:DNA repair exonuclease SbcCD ATPase subunit
MQSNRLNTARGRLTVLFVLLAIVAIGAGLAYMLTRPSQSDFEAANTTQISDATKAREALAPAVNTYLAAFKAAYNETNSAEQATRKAEPEMKAFKEAEAEALEAIAALDESKIAYDGDIGPAVKQLEADYAAEVTYYASLLSDYPRYNGLFSKNADGCSGVFVGEADGLSDRKAQLDVAAKQCFAALDALKASKNLTYAEYAKKVERRVKRLQADAATTVKAEQTLKNFEKRAADYQRQYDEAKARNASTDEILKLADELKTFNAQIATNRSTFEFAAKNYINTVKELPDLYSNVYGTDVPTRMSTAPTYRLSKSITTS